MPTTNFLKQFNNKEVEIYCSQNNIRGKIQEYKNGLVRLRNNQQEINIPARDILSIHTTRTTI